MFVGHVARYFLERAEHATSYVGGKPPPRMVLGRVPRHKCRGNSGGSCVECYALANVRDSAMLTAR